MPRSAAQTRSHVLEVAHELFYWRGIRATGIDMVAAEAGVAPTTLYRLFPSKDALVGAYVERVDRMFREWFDAVVRDAGPDPRDQVLAVVDGISAQLKPDQCRGCAFLMVLAEFPDSELPAHRNAITAKSWIRARLGELVDRLAGMADVADPVAMADQLTLVVEGLYASSQSLGSEGPARQARRLAEAILATAAPRPTGS